MESYCKENVNNAQKLSNFICLGYIIFFSLKQKDSLYINTTIVYHFDNYLQDFSLYFKSFFNHF